MIFADNLYEPYPNNLFIHRQVDDIDVWIIVSIKKYEMSKAMLHFKE